MSEAAKPAPSSGGAMSFRKSRYGAPRLEKDSAARQGDITRIAFAHLGGRDEAIAFLNTTDEALGGRPLDLAIASDEGFASVERAIVQRAGSATTD